VGLFSKKAGRKIAISFAVAIVGIAVVIIAGLATMFAPLLEGSDNSNCVVVDEEASFIGERLKHKGQAEQMVIKTTLCIEKDVKIDGGNGPKIGLVRWVVCFKGPDCDEAGMF